MWCLDDVVRMPATRLRLRRRTSDQTVLGSIRPWLLRWVLGQGSSLPLSQGEAFTLASISYLAILVKYILAKKKKKKKRKHFTLQLTDDNVNLLSILAAFLSDLSGQQANQVIKRLWIAQHREYVSGRWQEWHTQRLRNVSMPVMHQRRGSGKL